MYKVIKMDVIECVNTIKDYWTAGHGQTLPVCSFHIALVEGNFAFCDDVLSKLNDKEQKFLLKYIRCANPFEKRTAIAFGSIQW